jgi:hypothetical protein
MEYTPPNDIFVDIWRYMPGHYLPEKGGCESFNYASFSATMICSRAEGIIGRVAVTAYNDQINTTYVFIQARLEMGELLNWLGDYKTVSHKRSGECWVTWADRTVAYTKKTVNCYRGLVRLVAFYIEAGYPR